VEKLRRIAQIALQEFDGDLDRVLKQPLAQAKKSLKKFPGIGETFRLWKGKAPLNVS